VLPLPLRHFEPTPRGILQSLAENGAAARDGFRCCSA
jgi:hypothetical protein